MNVQRKIKWSDDAAAKGNPSPTESLQISILEYGAKYLFSSNT